MPFIAAAFARTSFLTACARPPRARELVTRGRESGSRVPFVRTCGTEKESATVRHTVVVSGNISLV